MSKMKPVGSERLPFDDKLKRIMEIARYNDVAKKPVANPNETTHYIKEAVDGFYGVVRERDGYYVKYGLNENALDYIGGMKMKNKNRFNSYAEAVKRCELIARPLTEQKHYVLDKPSVDEDPKPEASMDTPSPDAPPAETGDEGGAPDAVPAPEGGDEVPAADAPDTGGDDMGTQAAADAPKYMKHIQKLCGKLGQILRAHGEEMQSDDIKYVLNSVISAVDISKLEDNDKEEIGSRFEDSQYDDDMGSDIDDVDDSDFGDVSNDDEVPADSGNEAPAPQEDEKEMGEEAFDDIYENFVRLQKILKG
jgi:hypothetical protein